MPEIAELISTDACTLPTAERPLRLAEVDQLFQESVRSVTSDGLRTTLLLVDEPGLQPRVQDLLDRESACCSFFDFALNPDGADLVLEIGVPPLGRTSLTHSPPVLGSCRHEPAHRRGRRRSRGQPRDVARR